MFASTITDLGLAALMVLVGIAAIMVARTAKELKATLPGIKFEVGQINRAVNHVKPGEPTLIAQVGEIREWKDRQETLLREHMNTTKSLRETIFDRMDVVEDHMKEVKTHLGRIATTAEYPVVVDKLSLDLD